MAQVFTNDRPMTDDEILAGLQKAMRRLDGWHGYLDDDGAARAEALMQTAREALAHLRTSNLIQPNLPLAACPTCAMFPDRVIGYDAQQLDVTVDFDSFGRYVRGLIQSVTLDCGHELTGPLLGKWVTAGQKMRDNTAAHWRAEAQRHEERADELEGDNLELQEKYRRRLRKARRRTKTLRADIRALCDAHAGCKAPYDCDPTSTYCNGIAEIRALLDGEA